jgi:hypothetical protein
MELAGLIVEILSFLVACFAAWYTRKAVVFERDSDMPTNQAKGTERGHRPRDGRSRSVWIKAISLTTSALCIFAVGFLLRTQPGGPPALFPSITPSSNGPSSSVQPGGDGPTLPDQAGYSFRWQTSMIIDNTGVIFQQTGPVSAPESVNSDLTYSGDSGWGGAVSDLSLWLPSGAPSPSDCASQNSGYTGINTLAKAGDRYCFINNQSPNGPIVVSLEVTHVQTDNATDVTSVTLDAWAWSPR